MHLPRARHSARDAARFILAAFVYLTFATASVHATDAAEERERKIYSFEHRALPKWTHGSNGAFYDDLARSHPEQLIKTADELLGPDFGSAIRLRVLTEPEAVLIVFPAPTKPPHCYFAAVAKTKGGFRYITAEKCEDLLGEGLKAALGEWTAEGAHRLLGFSKDASEAWFVRRLGELLSTAENPDAPSKPAAKDK